MNARSDVSPILPEARHPADARAPLVVDLDGTLTPTDTLLESIVLLLKRSLLNALKLPFWLAKGRAFFKGQIARNVAFRGELLPLRQPLLDYRREQKADGDSAKGTLLLNERRYNRFQRSFNLPPNVDEKSVEAKLVDGVLTIVLNKREESKPRKINVA